MAAHKASGKSLSRDVFAAKRLDVLGRRGPGQQGESEARHHDSGEGDLPPRPPHDPPLPRHHYTCSGPPWTQSWTPSASASASPKFPPEISAEPAAAPSFSPGRRGSRECRPPSSIETETGTRPQEEHDALRPKQVRLAAERGSRRTRGQTRDNIAGRPFPWHVILHP